MRIANRRLNTYCVIITAMVPRDLNDNDDEMHDDDDFYSDEYDDEYDSEDDIDDAFGDYLMAAMHAQGEELRANQQAVRSMLGVQAPTGPTPEELFTQFLAGLSRSHMLKLTDECMNKYGTQPANLTETLLPRIHSGMTHVILGDVALSLIDQNQLFPTLGALQLTYLKMSPKNPIEATPLLAFLQNLISLTELELHNLHITHEQIPSLTGALSKMSQLKQLNIFGISCSHMDSVLEVLSHLETLDELRLGGASKKTRIEATALDTLLRRKPKWWRLGLENLNLGDDHCQVLAQALTRPNSKVGDLLSLEHNPSITDAGYKILFDVCHQKSRMGLIRVDNKMYEQEFDLVRALNNLRGRLDVIEADGTIQAKGKWVEFLHKAGNLGWESDAKKINNVWFMIRKNPEMVSQALLSHVQ